MLFMKLTIYGTDMQIIVNFSKIVAMIESTDGTKIIAPDLNVNVNEKIDWITETLDRLNGNDAFSSN